MQSRKKVLLVGTSFSAIPLLKELKKQGFNVSVCGGLKDDPCHKYAEKSFYIDYSKKDKLLKLCQDEEFDYIVPSCNDFAYNSASYVADKLDRFYGFDSYDTTLLLHTKNSFREFTLKHDLEVPKALSADEDMHKYIDTLSFPLLVKPDDSFSGQGVTKVSMLTELQDAIDFAKINSRNDKAVVEEFVEGTLHSHSAFIQDGEVLIDFFVDEFCSVYPYQVDSSCISYTLSDEIKDKVRKDIHKLVELLNLSNGLLHTQFIVNNTDFWLIETMRRCPGDLYGTLIQKSTNFNYAEFYLKPFLNQKNDIKTLQLDTKYIARHTISATNNLIFKSLRFLLKSEKLDFFPLKESGSLLKKAPFDKVGLTFYEFDMQQELIQNTKHMKNYFVVDEYEGIKSEQ